MKRIDQKRIPLLLILIVFLSSFKIKDGEIDVIAESASKVLCIDTLTNQVYQELEFSKDTLNKDVFETALKGYAKLKNADKLGRDSMLVIIDYSLSSKKKRLWVINLNQNKVVLNTLVAHGKNTGGEYARRFSNRSSSRMSSMGFMITGEVYNGKHKHSLKLNGVEYGYNTNVHARGVVIHGASYVREDLVEANLAIGRSFGCPAVSKEVNAQLIDLIKDGVCVFAYYPNPYYLSHSKYANYSGGLLIANSSDQAEMIDAIQDL